MKIELHVLQNFAPSNLNRDDTGAPKDCDFGGYRRARLSSQSQKRAVRDYFRIENLLSEEELGARTKRLVHQVTDELVANYDYEREPASILAKGAITGVGLGLGTKGESEDLWKTQYLLFVPRRIPTALAKLLNEHKNDLKEFAELMAKAEKGEEEKNQNKSEKAQKQKKKSGKDAKKAAEKAYPKEIKKKVIQLLSDTQATADLALFGRMIADEASWNVDASCQVAQAISTNTAKMDFDFFTAIDDLKPSDTAGSDMMGTVQFTSSCFYRYAVLDVDALKKNLQLNDSEQETKLTEKTVKAFARAFVSAIPTGKQNSMAAHNFPSYILAIVRDSGQSISLTNAFLKPARPRNEKIDLVDDSISKIEDYYTRMEDVMGSNGYRAFTWADRDLDSKSKLTRSKNLENFYASILTDQSGAES